MDLFSGKWLALDDSKQELTSWKCVSEGLLSLPGGERLAGSETGWDGKHRGADEAMGGQR